MIAFVSAVGTPHPKSDPLYEVQLPAVSEVAHAQGLPKAPTVAKTTAEPTAAPKPADKPPVCPDTQWIWAQDGQCHDKPVVTQPVAVQTAPVRQVQTGSAIGGCGNEENLSGMDYVFCHESTKNPTATNAEGCVGLGQACPASKLYSVCPDLNVNCQIDFFTQYAVSRYGSWSGAEAFWRVHRWW